MSLSIGYQTALELLSQHVRPGAQLIDAGAFPGTLTRELAKMWRCIALDIDPDRPCDAQGGFHCDTKSVARSFAEEMREAGIETRKTDIECGAWDLPSNSVDAVVMTEVIEHLYVDPLNALTEANRVLKPDGVFLVSTPNLTSLRNRISFAQGRMDRVLQRPFDAFLQKRRLGHYGHVRTYSPAELEGFLVAAGFSVEMHLFSFLFWEGATYATGARVGSNSPRGTKMRFLKSPTNYCRAAFATAISVAERLHEPFRLHMYAIAKKTREVTDLDLARSAPRLVA
jgi:SAM-dependent methyltransferase